MNTKYDHEKVRDAMAEIIANEDRRAPLTDLQLRIKLRDAGLVIPSDRLVANFRQKFGYPGAFKRRNKDAQ